MSTESINMRAVSEKPEPAVCTNCGDPVAPRSQHGPNFTSVWVIPVDERGQCPTCAWLEGAESA